MLKEDDINTKIYAWYACSECNPQRTRRQSYCVTMVTLRSDRKPNEWSKTEINNKYTEIADNLNCTSGSGTREPKWEKIDFQELVNTLNSDPKVIPECKLNLPVIYEEPKKQKSRFSDLDIV